VKKRADRTDNPEGTYACISHVLERLGFAGEATDTVPRRWIIAEGSMCEPSVLGQIHGELMQQVMPKSIAQAISVVNTAAAQRPQSLDDFTVLNIGCIDNLQPLSVLVYPKGFAYLVKAPDCIAWAMTTRSRGKRWGSHGRPGEDDRVLLALYSGFGSGRTACAAHWYNTSGEERTRPSISSHQGQSHWCETYMNQIFVLRLLPQQQVALAGFQITGRPFDPPGKLLAMVVPDASIATAPADARQILASLPEDSREAPQSSQGRRPAPPPPSSKHFRF
jgi:hypothetical protein